MDVVFPIIAVLIMWLGFNFGVCLWLVHQYNKINNTDKD